MSFSADMNLWGGDQPYFTVEVKGVMNYITFSKKMEYFRPTHKRAIMPGYSTQDVKDNGWDLVVRPWSWWIVFDDITEISCMFHSGHGMGATFSLYDGHIGTNVDISLTEAQAEELFTKVQEAIYAYRKYFKTGRRGTLRPSYKVAEYRVKSVFYTHEGAPAPTPSKHKVVFKPDT
jgi:hypothetical protein